MHLISCSCEYRRDNGDTREEEKPALPHNSSWTNPTKLLAVANAIKIWIKCGFLHVHVTWKGWSKCASEENAGSMRVLFIPLQSVQHVSLDIYHLSSDELQSCTDCIKNTWDFLLLETRHKFDVALSIKKAEMFCNHLQTPRTPECTNDNNSHMVGIW
jgi:hypothetical protein